MSDKPRCLRKAGARLRGRIKDFEATMAHPGDTARKHPAGFHRPGSNKK